MNYELLSFISKLGTFLIMFSILFFISNIILNFLFKHTNKSFFNIKIIDILSIITSLIVIFKFTIIYSTI